MIIPPLQPTTDPSHSRDCKPWNICAKCLKMSQKGTLKLDMTRSPATVPRSFVQQFKIRFFQVFFFSHERLIIMFSIFKLKSILVFSFPWSSCYVGTVKPDPSFILFFPSPQSSIFIWEFGRCIPQKDIHYWCFAIGPSLRARFREIWMRRQQSGRVHCGS